MHGRRLTFTILALGAAILLGGCASQQAATGSPASVARNSPPPEPMGGRWQLAAPGGSQCIMMFGAAAGEGEGTIAPEGGCPGNFYTSRKWSFEQDTLVIRDHKGQPLGQLALASPGRFDGKATNGQQVMLSR